MIFTKTQLAKYADVMIWAMENARRGGKFKKYDTVLVRYDKAALPLAHAIYEKLLEKKYLPTAKSTLPEEIQRSFYTLADDKQLKHITAGEAAFQESLNGLIALHAPEDLTALKTVNPARIGTAAQDFIKVIHRADVVVSAVMKIGKSEEFYHVCFSLSFPAG